MEIHLITTYLYFYLSIANICFGSQISNCGDWEAYRDEKCFRILANYAFETYENAIIACKNYEASSLVTINSDDEQQYLHNLLQNVNKIYNDIWIGAKYTDASLLRWNDNTAVNYTNWALNFPVNQTGYECVQMTLDASLNGKWVNEPCAKKNLVVCQKIPDWSTAYLLKTVIELRTSFEKVSNQLYDTKNEMESLRNQLKESSPPGTVAYFARQTPPIGWLKANGANISRHSYANLFSAIGTRFGCGDGNNTFTLPDLRGEFIRGWSDERDVDNQREFGSFQFGSSVPLAGYIDHSVWGVPIAATYQDRWIFAGETYDSGFERNVDAGQARNGISFPDASSDKSEVSYVMSTHSGHITSWNVLKGSRPRNIALLACIKY